MGIGPSMQETTLHYYRDPLAEVLSEDDDINFLGIIVYGCADDYTNKMLAAKRVGVTVEALRADGALLSCNGLGNNHVDYAQCIEEIEKRGTPTVALSMVPGSEIVTQNRYMKDIVCFYKAKDVLQIGDETGVLAENTVSAQDGRKALARLKLKMRKQET